MKRKISELMIINKKGDTYIDDKLEWSISGFRDGENFGDIPNEMFLLVIIATMANIYTSRILIEGEILCDIMHAKLFERMGFKKEKLLPYMILTCKVSIEQ